MMKRRFKKSVIALMVIVAMISVTACTKKNNTANNKNNAVNDGSNTGDNTPNDANVEENVGNQAENGGIVDRYNTLLANETNRENVYGFIGENITNASEAEADQLIYGILEYEDTYENVDYARLYAYKNYVSDEVEEFLELMYENHEKPYMNGTELGVTLDELLDRAEDFEEHIADFPDGVTTKHSYDMYVKLMDAAIVGGYDKENKVANYYKGDANNRIDGRAVDEYMKFLADEVDDDDNNKISTNTTGNVNTDTTNNTTANNTTTNNRNTTTNNANTTANNTTGNDTTTNNRNTTTNNTTTNNGTTNNTTTNNGTTNNGTTNNNATVNVGDNSEDHFDAPITRSIVQEYVDLLVASKNEITTEVEDFYANLHTLIAEKFGM